MKYFVLESGSKGNCTVVKGKQATIVIDCGGTKKHLKDKFKEIDTDYQSVDALLITHEHSDHIKQVKMFSDVDIFSPCRLQDVEHSLIRPYEEFEIKGLKIMPIALSHDVAEVVGYIISEDGETLVSVTDTGYISHANERYIQNADYYIFESNYDSNMLMTSNRPVYLKVRIISDNGHMGNEDSARVLSKVIGDKTKEITLAHLSQECNTEEIALKTLYRVFRENNIDCDRLRISAARQTGIFEGGSND